nr:hypothetical protein [Lactobacillus taiwanensis]
MANESKIVTLKNGYHVWTRKEGNEPIKILLLHGGPGKDKTYRNLKDAFIIFLRNFKPKKDDKFYESYHNYCDQDRSKQLPDGATKIIINSQKSAANQSEDLQALAKLMNNELVNLNKHFDCAQKKLKKSMKISKS